MSATQTGAQVLVGAGPDGFLPPKTLALGHNMGLGWFRKVRIMRRDPTLAFLGEMFAAPILSSEWSVSCDDEEKYGDAVDRIKESTLPFREKLLEDAIRGLMDFGWQPFEIVKEQHSDGTFYIEKYKALLQDLTSIVVDWNGDLVGLRNMATYSYVNVNPVFLYRGECLVMYRDVEGTNWYGEAVMRRAERPYDSWLESDDAARRFDNKMAGAHWVVYYPIGTSLYKGQEDVDNFIIANDILAALSSSGKVAVPSTILRTIDDLSTGVSPNTSAWRIELLSASVVQASFVDRGRYLDSLKSRAVGIPERASLEGQFGTKAEAEAHADFAIDNVERFHRVIVHLLNQQAVNVLLELNHGPSYKNKVYIKPAPLSDAKRAFLKQLYMAHIGTESGQAEETDLVDYSAIRDQLDIPIKSQPGVGHVVGPAGQSTVRRLPNGEQEPEEGDVGPGGVGDVPRPEVVPRGRRQRRPVTADK